jgi:imidazole glycerol-phosphate synthase subunit HisF
VKTVKFADPKYVGDPINAVRIFNEKEADELIVVDIDATRLGREPDYQMISKLANECRMPLCYGGGVRTSEQIERIIELGVEKVALGSAAVDLPDLISRAAARVGSQSVVGVIDVKQTGLSGQCEVVTCNASRRTGLDPIDFAIALQKAGAGEIVVNSVDRDGTLQGYDMDLVARLRAAISLPITVLGGAGSLADVEQLYKVHGIIGAAAGSLFVFKGRYRAVLINYPNRSERDAVLQRAGIAD